MDFCRRPTGSFASPLYDYSFLSLSLSLSLCVLYTIKIYAGALSYSRESEYRSRFRMPRCADISGTNIRFAIAEISQFASPNNADWQIPKGFTRHFTRLCKNSPGGDTQPHGSPSTERAFKIHPAASISP